MDNKEITYKEALDILHKRHKLDANEFRYLIKNEKLIAYTSDIPLIDETLPTLEANARGITYYPENLFYFRDEIETWEPNPRSRFVYIRDLVFKRMWAGDEKVINNNLIKAGRDGILQWYEFDSDTFSVYSNPLTKRNWATTDKGRTYVENPDSFFLLYDIINLERIYFNRSKEDCLKELGIENA